MTDPKFHIQFSHVYSQCEVFVALSLLVIVKFLYLPMNNLWLQCWCASGPITTILLVYYPDEPEASSKMLFHDIVVYSGID